MLDLADIIAKLERAKKPDREIDNMVALAVAEPIPIDPADWPPAYTASIDAAFALALPGYQLLVRDHNGRADYDGIGKGKKAFASLSSHRPDGPIHQAYAANPAIAICTVAMLAREHAARTR